MEIAQRAGEHALYVEDSGSIPSTIWSSESIWNTKLEINDKVQKQNKLKNIWQEINEKKKPLC